MTKAPRIGADLIEYLQSKFQPRCIGPGETLESAHRHAGKVELAQMLIRMGRKDEDHDIEFQED